MRSLFACVIAMVSVAAASATEASPVSQLVVFGDSLSDTGNVYNATAGAFPPSPPYFDGRFSNGPVWVEHLADALGIARPTPSTAGGANYAFGGSLSGTDSTTGFPGMLTQIDAYTGGGNTPGNGQLFILWTGANDFLLAGENQAADPVANLIAGLTTLADAGAARFLVPNLPNLSALPGASRPPSEFVTTPEDVGERSGQFNALLGLALDQFEQAHPGIELIRFNAAGLLEDMLLNPGAYGLTNTTDPYLESDLTADPAQYLFWDTVHATSTAHAILGEQAAALVPEPAALATLALLPLLLNRRRHRF